MRKPLGYMFSSEAASELVFRVCLLQLKGSMNVFTLQLPLHHVHHQSTI